jgi:hypothetical protein
MRDPVPVGFDPSADLVEVPERAEGGRVVADDVEEAVDAVLEPRVFADCDLTGE